MKRKTIKDLKKGIYLEHSNKLIKWGATLHEARKIGEPVYRKFGSRETLSWKKENIMNGIPVNLIAVFENKNKNGQATLDRVSAYISESDYTIAINDFDDLLGIKGEYQLLSAQHEFKHSWSHDRYKVNLTHLDRLGTYYKLEITGASTAQAQGKVSSVISILTDAFEKVQNVFSKIFERFFFRREFIKPLALKA